MPRLNIEDEAFGDARLEKLARLIRKSNFDKDDLSHRAALGFMAFVWRASQDAGKAAATGEEIDLWSGVDGFHALALEAGYLRRTEDGIFEIRGNARQIEGLNAWREQRKIAGKASARARAEAKTNDRSTTVQQPLTTVQQPSTGPQRNSTQLQDQDQIQRSNKIPPTPHDAETGSSSPDGDCGDEDGGKEGQTAPETVAEEPGGTETPPKRTRAPKTPKSDLTPEAVAERWNAGKHPLQPGVDPSRLNPARKRKIVVLLERHPTAAEWEQAIARVAEWEFGQGANDSRWVADFDWFLSSKGERAFDGPLQSPLRQRPARAGRQPPRSAAPDLPPLRVLEETVTPEQQAADLETLRAAQAALAAAPKRRT